MGRMVRMDIYLVADVLDQSVSIWSSHDVAHEAWQRPYSERSRPLRTSSILDRLHPIGFGRGGV